MKSKSNECMVKTFLQSLLDSYVLLLDFLIFLQLTSHLILL